MPDINVDYDAAQRTANRIKAGQAQIDETVNSLRNEIANLMEHGFKTQHASREFHDYFTEWATGIKQESEGLTAMSEFLGTVVRSYQGLDESEGPPETWMQSGW